MNLTEKSFKITGVFPLMTRSPKGMTQNSGPKTKKIPTPEEEAEKGLYVNDDGTYYLPSFAFRSCLLTGLKGKKIGKVGAATVFKPAIFNADEKTTILNPKTMKPIKKYEIDSRRAIIQRQGIIRHRPKFKEWAAIVTFLIDEEVVSAGMVEEHFDIAGTIVGVGDFRIEKGGPFGSFRAELYEKK